MTNSRKDQLRIGLALSGGGFRSTLFHLGVIRCLWENDLLSAINNICSVSGGSVLAAHIALNWQLYSGNSEDFDKAANEIIQLVRYDVRGHILRRMLTAYGFLGSGSTKQLQKYYSKLLFQSSLLKDLEHEGAPYIHILCTNLTNHGLCSFTPDGFTIDYDPTISSICPIVVPTQHVPLSFAVSASSAFPAFFPPVEISPERLNVEFKALNPPIQYITDGGIYDNICVRKFRQLMENKLCKSLLTKDDILDANRFISTLHSAAKSNKVSPDKRVFNLLGESFRSKIKSGDVNDPGFNRELLSNLNCLLKRFDLFDTESLTDSNVSEETINLINLQDPHPHPLKTIKLNRLLLESVFPDCFSIFNGKFDHILISDAGLNLDRNIDLTTRFPFILGSALRATDILSDRIRSLEVEHVLDDPIFTFINIKDISQDQECPSEDLQRSLQYIRTDLDKFSWEEISGLVRHGYCITRKTLRDKGIKERPVESTPWDPSLNYTKPRNDQSIFNFVKTYSYKRKFGLFSIYDPISYIHIALILALISVWLCPIMWFRNDIYDQIEKEIDSYRVTQEVDPATNYNESLVLEREKYNEHQNRPRYGKFDILLDKLIFDLRSWEYVPINNLEEQGSAVVMERNIRFSKKKPVNEIIFEFRTSGLDVIPECKSDHEYDIIKYKNKGSVGSQETLIRQIRIDIKDVPLEQEIDVLLSATYWNAFQDENQMWVGTLVYGDIDKVSLAIVFPEDKPFKDYDHRIATLDGKNEISLGAETIIYEDRESKQWLHFEVNDSKPGQVYKVYWDWYNE